MKLIFSQAYKFIKAFPLIDLPDFVVMTGVNGAGKTHLLKAIYNGYVQIDGVFIGGNSQPIRLFNWSNLVPNDSCSINPSQLL